MRSIAARLTIAYTVSLFVTLALLFFAGSQLIESRLVQASGSLVDSEFGRLRNHIQQGPPTTDAAILEKRLRRLTNNTGNLLYVEVRYRDGRTLFSSTNLGKTHIPTLTAERYDAVMSVAGDVEVSRYDIPPYYHILIATSRHPVLSALEIYKELFAALFVATLLIGAGTGFVLSQLSLRPLRNIRDTCKRISLETLDARIPVSRVNDEISSLSKLLNEMLDRLDASIGEMRRFTSDASHELKTPLALMRLHVDRMLADESLSADQRAAVEELTNDMAHLQQTISGLLLLSRLDSKSLPVEMIGQSPVRFMESMQNDLAALSEHGDCTFDLIQHGEGQVVFDARWLRQVMLNLITNSIRASAAGGAITVETMFLAESWQVTVGDRGIGLPAGQHERIFERFTRASSDEDGCGLGLAICKSIIRLHGGSIVAIDGMDGVGLRVVFTLPLGETPRNLSAGPSIESVKAIRRHRPATVASAPQLQA